MAKLPTLLLLAQAPAPAPSAPAPPPAPAATGGIGPAPGEVPPDEAPAPSRLDITGTYPQVKIIRILGMVWLVLAGVLALVMNNRLGSDESSILNLGLGVGLIGAGMGMGILGFIKEDWRKLMGYFSAFAIIGGVAARPILAPIVTYDVVYVVPAVLFAFAFFLYMEYLDAYQRFTDVARMAVERALPNFNLAQVINNFLTRGLMLAVIFMLVALVLLSFATQGIAALMGQTVGNSVEMQSVFGQALVITIVFTLVGVIYVFLFMLLDRKTDVEQVAYSREQIKEMVVRGQNPTEPSGPSGPAVPGGPRGTSPGLVEQR